MRTRVADAGDAEATSSKGFPIQKSSWPSDGDRVQCVKMSICILLDECYTLLLGC